MNKKMIGTFLFLLVVFLGENQMLRNQQSSLLMENVEALTAGEVAEVTKHSICYMNVTFDEEDSRVSTVTYCGGRCGKAV